jgi:hypothetical protein
MAGHDDRRPTSSLCVNHDLCRTGTCGYGWSKGAVARRAAEDPPEAGGVIETPCWIRGAATLDDLELVYGWNEMVQFRKDHAADPEFTLHLTILCLGLGPHRTHRTT